MGWYPMPAQKEVSNMEHNKGEVLWEYCDQGTCKHKDCARYWEDRERPCKFCGELIEIDTKRYLLENNGHAHFSCFHNVKKHFGI